MTLIVYREAFDEIAYVRFVTSNIELYSYIELQMELKEPTYTYASLEDAMLVGWHVVGTL